MFVKYDWYEDWSTEVQLYPPTPVQDLAVHLQQFHSFPKLPTELRDLIWQLPCPKQSSLTSTQPRFLSIVAMREKLLKLGIQCCTVTVCLPCTSPVTMPKECSSQSKGY
jgi:hypothetical protein